MPGATDARFFAGADMLDTKVGRGGKDDPAAGAKIGFVDRRAAMSRPTSWIRRNVPVMLVSMTCRAAAKSCSRNALEAAPGVGQ
jgi:hypothetical protein